ncbi:Arylsulfatase precursor [Planctomycetes bacterium MalM25]|nr:Arylsulfatase precursor [Planctomycetes bacterium MalM25]
MRPFLLRFMCSAPILGVLLFALPALAQRPNVVFVLIDDLSHYGVSAYGSTEVSEKFGRFDRRPMSTPRIDRLAEEGLLCEQAYIYPLCEPSRVALMTGQYNSRNFLKAKSLHASQITFGDVFQRAGYTTGMFGKWKQTRGTKDLPAKDYLYRFGWDEFCCFDVTDEGRRYLNPLLVENGELVNYKNKPTEIDPETGRRWYGPDIVNRHALDFIDRHRDEPFFLYYPMILVHDEHTPTPDTTPRKAYDTFPDTNCRNKPCDGDDRYYFPDMVMYADKLIGNVIDKLDALGLRENTLVVVMGDNGTKEPFVHHLADGSDYVGGKGDTKDNGLHVPLVFSQPGKVPAGSRYAGLVDVVDLCPTLYEATEIDAPNADAIDGLSFWDQVAGAAGEHRDHIYTWYNANRQATDLDRVLRYAFDKDFKRYAPHHSYPEGRFFDLRTDRLERGGDRQVEIAFKHIHHSGLPAEELDPEQRRASERLQAIVDAHAYVAVTDLKLSAPRGTAEVGETLTLACQVLPADATRQNVVWESSDPEVASINKFGELTAHRPGRARVTVFSWDDARPLADRSVPAYSRDGVSDTLEVRVGGS